MVSLGWHNISGVPFNIEGRSCHIYRAQKWNLCFGQKYMSQMERVFSKLASPREARVVSLGRQNISRVPFTIEGRSCHICPAQNWNLCFWAEIYVSNGESVLEAGKST